jgi:hypothetical protein
MSNRASFFLDALVSPAMSQRHILDAMTKTTSRDILAENLRRFREADGDPSVRAWALRKGLDVKLIERLTKNSHSVTLDKLEEVAAACGLQAWQMLIPGIDPENPPQGNITAKDRALLARLHGLIDKAAG